MGGEWGRARGSFLWVLCWRWSVIGNDWILSMITIWRCGSCDGMSSQGCSGGLSIRRGGRGYCGRGGGGF